MKETPPDHQNTTEQLVNREVERAILDSPAIDTGKNGVIFKVDSKKLSRTLPETDDQEPAVPKVLKVYAPGLGQHEFNDLSRAHRIVSEHPDQKNLANIPRPLFFGTLKISPETRKKINSLGGKVYDKADVLIMEFVPGKDLATILLEAVLKYKNYDRERISDMDFATKLDQVSQQLNFKEPGQKATDKGEREHERIIVLNKNAQNIFDFLRHKNFRINPAIVSQIRKTVDALQTNRLFHVDLHERNIMIDGDPTSPNSATTVTIIDFGQATDQPNEGEEKFIDPLALTRRLEELLPRHKQPVDNQELRTFFESINSDPAFLKKYQNMKDRLGSKDFAKSIMALLNRARSNDYELDLAMATVAKYILESHGASIKKRLKKALAKYLQTETSPFVAQRINSWAKYIFGK